MSRAERKARREAWTLKILDAWVEGVNDLKKKGGDVNSMSGKEAVLRHVNATVKDFDMNNAGHMVEYAGLVNRAVRVLNKTCQEKTDE